MMQTELTKADLASRPFIVRYDGGSKPGFIGFKTAEAAEGFKDRAAEYGPTENARSEDLPNGWWRPFEMWEQSGINAVAALQGGHLWAAV